MNQTRNIFIAAILMLSLSLIACRKEDKTTTLSIGFKHSVGSNALIKDSLKYINAAGNHYVVNELQYFISDIILHKTDGEEVTITQENGIHYVDMDIPGTLNWDIDQEIPGGEYSSVSFTFGINEAKNKTGLFVNPPERDMFWPDAMGGGYHYMKMNGQWLDINQQITPFNFHLGIGMTEGGMGGMGFVQNYFTVQVPNSGMNLTSDTDYKLILNMDIASWFETPNLWDWNIIGGQIMQKQWAMEMACENGADAFSCNWTSK